MREEELKKKIAEFEQRCEWNEIQHCYFDRKTGERIPDLKANLNYSQFITPNL